MREPQHPPLKKTFACCDAVVCSDSHTRSSRAPSQTQLTASRMDLNLKILMIFMWFCPLHTTALVSIQMLAANLAPTQFSCSLSSSSHPPILSVTAMPNENSAFLWIALSQIEILLHERRPELFHGILSRELGPGTPFCVWPNSSCFLVKDDFLFFPLLCTDWRTMTMTMTHSVKVNQRQSAAWPHMRE